ncbi:Rhodanese domain protein [Burkholderia humptydooensis MSMB43]|uniref:Rhodanese domain protein n=1 Tax=Burkholderia humptydooensis MSMB43 TaxID=441157 RepID=A0ABN0G4K0_9BURK|nr:Rhodanese domain protein [Burkholderia humptydooensis MSMB43]
MTASSPASHRVADSALPNARDCAPARLPALSAADVRAALLAGAEIALIDVREEDPYARGHPLWAANFPLSKLELDAWTRIPRRDTTIAIYGEALGEDLAPRAAAVLASLGYTRVHLLEGGLAGWQAAGGELFIDVNVPSKAFGELVEAKRHTPSLSAQEVKQLIDARADVVIVDARRFDEYQTMSIPGATSVPGAELVLRVRELAPDPATRVIVNCAGRTRSIIGAQSLVNAGLPNPVAALRNGTIGWTLAGQTLDHGASRRFPEQVDAARREAARQAARGCRAHCVERAARARGRRSHALSLRRAHAGRIRGRPPAGLRERAGRPARAGDRPSCAGARRADRARGRRRRARRHDRVVARADGVGRARRRAGRRARARGARGAGRERAAAAGE